MFISKLLKVCFLNWLNFRITECAEKQPCRHLVRICRSNRIFMCQHFVCAKCEKPFHGHRHYEKKGLAYCEQHYHQLFGNLCYVCNQVIAGDGEYSASLVCAVILIYLIHHFLSSVQIISVLTVQLHAGHPEFAT